MGSHACHIENVKYGLHGNTVKPPQLCTAIISAGKKAPTIEKLYYHYFSCKDAKINPSNIIRQFSFLKKFFFFK